MASHADHAGGAGSAVVQQVKRETVEVQQQRSHAWAGEFSMEVEADYTATGVPTAAPSAASVCAGMSVPSDVFVAWPAAAAASCDVSARVEVAATTDTAFT